MTIIPTELDPHNPNDFKGYFPPPPPLDTKTVKEFVVETFNRASANGSYYFNKHQYMSGLFTIATVICCCYVVYARYYRNNSRNEAPQKDIGIGSRVELDRSNYASLPTVL